MKTVGIIAEYNPFHRGHEYQIAQIRKLTGARFIVVVMSGDFVQRGTPAWTDKFLRTEMALAGGADLVFELPVHYASASAEGFAAGGVSLLDSLGFVDGICFGSECGDLDALLQIAEALLDRNAGLQEKISDKMKRGIPYPAAREESLRQDFPSLFRQYPGLLSEANNILAIEYLKALKSRNSSLKAMTIARTGAPYHDADAGKSMPSSTAIRNHYRQTGRIPNGSVPDYIESLLKKHPDHFPVNENDCSDLLYYRLRTMEEDALKILDMTPELYRRILHLLPSYQTAEDFIASIKSKNYTHARIRRVLLHLLLNLYPVSDSVPYARLLGFRPDSSHLLRQETRIPVITKPANAKRVLAELEARKVWDADLRAHDLYCYLLKRKYPEASVPDDYHAGMVMSSKP